MNVYDTTTHTILTDILEELKRLNKHNAVYVESSLPVIDAHTYDQFIEQVVVQSKYN